MSFHWNGESSHATEEIVECIIVVGFLFTYRDQDLPEAAYWIEKFVRNFDGRYNQYDILAMWQGLKYEKGAIYSYWAGASDHSITEFTREMGMTV